MVNFVGIVGGRESIIADSRKEARTKGFRNPFEAQGGCQAAFPSKGLAVAWGSDFFCMEGTTLFSVTLHFLHLSFFFFLKNLKESFEMYLLKRVLDGRH